MKKVILVLGLVAMALSSKAQVEDFKSYYSTFESSDYEVKIDNNKTLYIYTGTVKRGEGTQLIIVYKAQVEMLTKQLNEARSKFIEWKEMAITNEVKKLNKSIPIKSKKKSLLARFKLYNEMKKDNSVILTYSFWITEIEGEPMYSLIIRTGKYTAESNQFMEHDGSVIVLTGIEEVNEFIDIFNIEAIESKEIKGDIFK